MNARVLATVPACLVLVLAASLFATPSAHAQCADWEAGPLDNGIAANGANGSVYCSTLWDPDGAGPIPAELVIGGAFTSIDGVPAHHLAIRDAYTGAWSELGGGVGTIALSLTTWNGMLVVGGTGDNYPDTPDNNVLGWNGSTWVSFNEGTSTGNVWALAVLNGELYAAGNFVIYPTTGDPAYNIAHWNSARNLFDPVAGPGTDPGENVNCLTTWNGSLWAGTYWHDYLGSAKGSVWQFDGTNWTDMVITNNSVAAFQPFNGELVVGGYFSVVGTSSIHTVMAYNGSIWHSYGNWQGASVNVLGVFNGQLVAGGIFNGTNGNPIGNIATWTGSSWAAMSGGVDSYPESIVQSGSDLVVGGNFVQAGGAPANHIALWNGSAWSPFGGGNDAGVVALTQYLGQEVIGGSFNEYAGASTPAHMIAGWNGATLSSFGTGMDGQVNALKSYSFGNLVNRTNELVAGGYFTHAGGVAASRIARWDQSSIVSTSPSWQPMGSGFDGAALAIERATIGASTNTYAGGIFQYSGGTLLSRVGRWNATSGAWEAMGSGMNGPVYALRAYGGYLYAGGSFTSAGGVATGGLARWDGASWTQVGGFFNGTVYALEVYQGQLVMAGNFPGINSSPNIAQYNGSYYSTFATGGTDFDVFALHAVGTRLYVGGKFNNAGGGSASRCAYWDGTGWHSMTAGTDNDVYALGDLGGEVLAGGAFTVAGTEPVVTPHLARFTPTGLAWFQSQPHSQTVASGASLSFTANPASGYSGATEHWYRNGTLLADGPTGGGSTLGGTATPTLTITNASNIDVGAYQAILADGCGDDSSATVQLDISTAGVDGRGLPAVTAMDAIGPNPSRGPSAVWFSLASPARVGLRVVDVAGRRVGGVELGALDAGTHLAHWDGQGSDGHAIPPGLYFVSLEVDGRPVGMRRVTFVR